MFRVLVNVGLNEQLGVVKDIGLILVVAEESKESLVHLASGNLEILVIEGLDQILH